ncbi:MAG: hypothetical protein KGI08_11550 [Thaumarchaeota archaeon]|nr:hypothetical protein [Nitrososphaerota archaeon]
MFRVFGVKLETSETDTMDIIRNSVYFMGKTATIPIDDLVTTLLEYADVIGATQNITGQSLPMQERVYMMYLCHLLLLDPNAYGLVKVRNIAR